ncbi:hypothetical protein RNJ44_00513 [Nakaseomyces bracarensis]|uniref:VPS10 domain-containing protein n=1 Tax=Nakaseomyces bracarensis TaxID=273131 RepID=A0ABR4NSS4_9SACH
MKLYSLLYTCLIFARAIAYTPDVTPINDVAPLTNIIPFDDSTTLFMSARNELKISFDNGMKWKKLYSSDNDRVHLQIDEHYGHSRAFVLIGNDLMITLDQGSNWSKMHIKEFNEDYQSFRMVTHPFIKKTIIAKLADRFGKQGKNFLSLDGGKSFKPLKANDKYLDRCSFLAINKDTNFERNDNEIVCIEETENKLYISKNRGKSFGPVDLAGDVVENYLITKSYVLAATREDRNLESSVNLFVSDDGTTFKKAYIPTRVNIRQLLPPAEIDGRRILLSFSSDMHNDNKNTGTGLRNSLISTSDGLKFSTIEIGESSSVNVFLPVQFLKGTIFMSEMNLYGNQMYVSADNGNSWKTPMYSDPDGKNTVQCPDNADSCPLNLNFVFPQEPTAGILFGSGSVKKGMVQTFVSRDGGLNWEFAIDSVGFTASGDLGNILIACQFDPDIDDDPLSEFYFSLDQGKTWEEYQLKYPLRPIELINTTPDGSGSRFILSGLVIKNDSARDGKQISYVIDFSNIYDGKKCSTNEYEEFSLSNGECINGIKYTYQRRKQDAKCIGGTVFEDLVFKEEICSECTDADYECSPEFIKNKDGQCVVDINWLEATGNCPNGEKKLPTKKLTADNKCKKSLEIPAAVVACRNDPSKQTGDSKKPNNSKQGTGNIESIKNAFDEKVVFYQYFDSEEDESLILVTNKGNAYTSGDGGKHFTPLLIDDSKIREVVFNKYFNSSAYLFDTEGNIHITHDRGHNFKTVQLPATLQLSLPLNFHAKDPNTFIYYGGKNCDSLFSRDCHVVSYITRDGGNSFSELLPNAIHCEFVGSSLKASGNDDLVFCQVRDKSSENQMQRSLVSSTDFFSSPPKTVFKTILGYITTGEYVIVAVPDEKRRELDAFITMDGDEFAEALLPYDMDFSTQEAFTVLGSNTGAVFMHFTTSKSKDFSYGNLLKSNTNGTSYVKLHSNVNRNQDGYVDFEKVQGLEGIILSNIVQNADKRDANDEKVLKTKITFNDGADWSYLSPPRYDSEGKKYQCNSKSLERCSLNLHGYTERKDYRDTYSSGSAIGMLIGIGNVGESLTSREEASTFLTIDGGKTWKEVKKGSYQWEFGDHGGVLVLAPEGQKTNTVSYSTDFGETWTDYIFSDEEVFITDIVTVPKDSALRFLLVTESNVGRNSNSATFTLDFSALFDRQCVLDHNNEKFDDFDYFTVGNSENDCLFGHQAKYLRKNKPNCFVGAVGLEQFTVISKNCSCTRADFECDYNYEKIYDGTCKLVEGLSPGDASAVCKKNPDLIEYFKSSGYRKIPLSTCHGGLKLDGRNEPMACPGKETEFKEKYGIKGSSFFFTFTIMFVFFCLIGWFIYDRGIRRNGGFARFGEIRLGDDQLIEENTTDKIVNSIIRFGVASFGAMSAGFNLFQRAANAGFHRVTGRINGRNRPSYSNLMHDDFLDEADDLLAGHDADANDLSSFMDDDSNFDIENEGGASGRYLDDIDDSDIPDPVQPSSRTDDEDTT